MLYQLSYAHHAVPGRRPVVSLTGQDLWAESGLVPVRLP